MPDSISLDAMYDVINGTHAKYPKPKWLDISRRRQRWPFAKQILKQRTKHDTGGAEYAFKVKVNKQTNARHVGGYAVVQTTVKDFNVEAKVPLRATMSSYAWDTMAEEEVQKSPERIVDVILQRRTDMYADALELMEDTGWSFCDDPNDKETPWGLFQTILPHPAVGTAAGFNAQNTSGWTTKQNLSGSSYTYWNNYTAPFKDVSNDDGGFGFVYNLFEAMDLTQFEAPVDFPNLSPDETDWGLYSSRLLRNQINQYLENRNDNYGQDLGNYHGDPVVRQNRVQWVPTLDSLTIGGTTITDPFVGINWAVMDVIVSRDWDWHEIITKPSDQPTVVRPTVWKKWNLINNDLSRHFFLNRF